MVEAGEKPGATQAQWAEAAAVGAVEAAALAVADRALAKLLAPPERQRHRHPVGLHPRLEGRGAAVADESATGHREVVDLNDAHPYRAEPIA